MQKNYNISSNLLCKLTLAVILTFFVQTASAQLSGTLIIGQGGDYTTFSAAVADLNELGVNGPVTFNVLNGIYTEQIQIIAAGTSTNTITFQSASGNAADVELKFAATGAGDNYVVWFNGCSYVTFRNITLTASGRSHGHVLTWAGATNSTIMNNVINGVSTTSITADRHELIFAIASTPPNDNTVISGNTINNGAVGVDLLGSSSPLQSGTQITNNTFVNQYYRGIWVKSQESPKIKGNTVSTSSTFNDFTAIVADDCQNDLEMRNNKINLGMGTGISVRNGIGTSANSGLVANNFVAIGNGGSVVAIGFQLQNNAYLNIYHNSVFINSSHTNFARALYLASGGSNNAVVNNILSSPGAFGYAYYVLSGTGAAISSSDYNDLEGSALRFTNWEGTNYLNLADFQTASVTDANSVSTPVTFADAANGDLHLSGSSDGDLTLTGTPLAAVTDDIDSDFRNTSTPYMGADEASGALPVELISFSYNILASGVELSWATITETNNFGFEVERKQEKSDWQRIGFVQGHGTIIGAQNYRFVDYEVNEGIYFYRLKQIDTDGSFAFSPTIMANMTPPTAFELSQNYPNPFNPATSISYSVTKDVRVKLTIFNILGNAIRTLVDEDKRAGSYSLIWNGKNDAGQTVPSGTYLYELGIDGKPELIRRMLLLK